MSYKVEFVLDLDDSDSMFFDKKNWAGYTFRFKEVFGGKLTNLSKHIPVGEYGHIKWDWNFKDANDAKWWMTYGDYYVDVYWKGKRIATEIRLREPQMGHWYSDDPNYDLRDGHQNKNFKGDKGKFDKLTSVEIALKLATTQAQSKNPEDTKKEQKILSNKLVVGNDIFTRRGLRIKGNEDNNGGPVHPGVYALAHILQANITGYNRMTAGNDLYHHKVRYHSTHKDGLALDFTLSAGSSSSNASTQVRNIFKNYNIKGTVLNEYARPTGAATGGHIHVNFASKVEEQKFVNQIK